MCVRMGADTAGGANYDPLNCSNFVGLMDLFRRAADLLNSKGHTEWAPSNYTFTCMVCTTA